MIEDYLKGGQFTVWEKKFSILQTSVPYEGAFANIKTGDDYTVVALERDATYSIAKKHIMNIDHNWRIITFEMELPFELIGFLAKISGALADAGVSIFVISSFFTDHILVKDNELEKTLSVLQTLGLSLMRD